MTTEIKKEERSAEAHGNCMVNRREFLLYSGAGITAASTVTLFPGTAFARDAQVAQYPRKLIGRLSKLRDNKPESFNYPDNLPNSDAMLVKMGGVEAGGGIGKQRDIVAFNYLCTHQGGPMQGTYQVEGNHRVLGQCPLHLSTYDLTRHGIVISGQAYQSLPQVLLELDGDKIYAVGMMGLIFGRNTNLIQS